MANLNIIARLQHWMESRAGQTFMNYAYSWGAAVVILGTLFKLTHIPGANIMLFVGMGTEVFVFFVAGFDRSGVKARDKKAAKSVDEILAEHPEASAAVPSNQTIVIAGGAPAGNGNIVEATLAERCVTGSGAVVSGGVIGAPADLSGLTDNIDELTKANTDYVEQLATLTETLKKVQEQASRMSTDSEEMVNLNRTLTGINTIYEMQLKSISTQVGTIDSINEQTRKMATQIEELNKIYARMIEAMTTNMPGAR